MRRIGNDRGATRKIASQGLSNSQTNISSETQPENFLALLPRNMMVVMVMVIVGMTQMPPSGDFVNCIVIESWERVLEMGIEGLDYGIGVEILLGV
jgi:hypothetical protein